MISPRIGVCADVGHWQRSGIKPVDGVRTLGRRLLSLHVKDLNESSPNGHDVWWGTGQGDMQLNLRNAAAGSIVRSESGVLGFSVSYVQTNGLTELAGGSFSGAARLP